MNTLTPVSIRCEHPKVDHITLLLILFYRDFWHFAVSKRVVIAFQSAVGQAQTVPQANASVLGTMVAGLAVVVACSASQDLAQEYAGLSKHGHHVTIVADKGSFFVSRQSELNIGKKIFMRPLEIASRALGSLYLSSFWMMWKLYWVGREIDKPDILITPHKIKF